MKLSVFTPTHDPSFLHELFHCLSRQTHEDWEWVVVPNGPEAERAAEVAAHVSGGDPRVRVEPAPPTLYGIGALKKYACERATGDVFVEVDHDDLVTDDCLALVADAAAAGPRALFIYSDGLTLNHDGTSVVFEGSGWRHYEWAWRGRKYVVNRSFPDTPRSLCEILYAPDHVRAWTRPAYSIAGGHNPELPVADDHELVIRTYLAGVAFAHVAAPTYVHRLRPESTSVTRVDDIQARSRHHRDVYLHRLVAEWCRRGSLPMYDLGGAHNCPDGFVPVDARLPGGVEGLRLLVPDHLEGGEPPIPHDSVGCFRAFDFLEHVPPEKVIRTMNVLYDLLVPGGYLLTGTPAVCDEEGRGGRGAYQDPTHASFWSPNNFWYYTDRAYAAYLPAGAYRGRFQTVRVANSYPSAFHARHLIPYVYWDGAALKEGNDHWPGPVAI